MLTDAQIDRFSRHILLAEVGGVGQEKLLASCVRVPELDARGRAMALWLARSGIGALALPDDRSPAPSHDPSGLLHANDEGRPMIEAVRERLAFHAPDLAFHDSKTVDVYLSAQPDRSGAEVALYLVRSIVGA